MSSCGSSTYDYVLSAIKYSKFEAAKKLCDILFFKDKRKFTYFYGIVNLSLNNEILVKAILLNGTFLDILNEEFKSQPQIETELCFDPSALETNLDFCCEKLRNEIINPKSNIRKVFEGNCKNAYFHVIKFYRFDCNFTI